MTVNAMMRPDHISLSYRYYTQDHPSHNHDYAGRVACMSLQVNSVDERSDWSYADSLAPAQSYPRR